MLSPAVFVREINRRSPAANLNRGMTASPHRGGRSDEARVEGSVRGQAKKPPRHWRLLDAHDPAVALTHRCLVASLELGSERRVERAIWQQPREILARLAPDPVEATRDDVGAIRVSTGEAQQRLRTEAWLESGITPAILGGADRGGDERGKENHRAEGVP